MQDNWQNIEYVQKQMKARGVSKNKLEKEFENILWANNFSSWQFVGDGKLIIGGKCPDFWNGNDKLIEIFGCYFHSCPVHFLNKGATPNNSDEKIQLFLDFGYKTLIVWEHDIRENLNITINNIKEFV